jgi:[acyl-carrier-protein] S-malonyltransferase
MSVPTAFIFPGQGQIPISLPTQSEEIESLYRQLERDGATLRQWMETGDPRIKDTEGAQPLILLDSLARLEVLLDHGVRPTAAAGHSLGEYGALVCCGVLTAEDAARIVIRRGRLMSGVPGGMTAILKLSRAEVEAICEAVGPEAAVANHNGPQQVVVSGQLEAVDRVAAEATARGARAVRLDVSGPFHSPYMRPAEAALRPIIEETPFEAPTVDFVSSVSGSIESDPRRIQQVLSTQITAPVLWVETVRSLEEAGVGRAIEMGGGSVLTNLGKRITDGIRFLTYEEALHEGV